VSAKVKPPRDNYQRACDVVARDISESIDLIQETSPERKERRETLLTIMSELAKREGYSLSIIALVQSEALVALREERDTAPSACTVALQVDEDIIDETTPAVLLHQITCGLHTAAHELIGRMTLDGKLAPPAPGETLPPDKHLH
jgi:hypothetical protein